MAKSKIVSKTAQKQDKATFSAVRFFIGGCAAESFLMLLRNYYVAGTAKQVVAWDGYMYPLAIVGFVIAALGVAGLFTVGKTCATKKEASLWILGGGLFVGLSSLLVKILYTTALTPLSYIVPLIMVLGILWSLYSGDCAVSVTVLGMSLLAVWVARQTLYHVSLGMIAHVALVVYMLCLVAVALKTRQLACGKKSCPCGVVTATTDPRGIYGACICSLLACATALVSISIAYYAMWVLVAVIFLFAVFYTVKQL